MAQQLERRSSALSAEFTLESPSRKVVVADDIPDEEGDFFIDGDDYEGIEGFGDLDELLQHTDLDATVEDHNADLFATIRSRLKSNATRGSGNDSPSTRSGAARSTSRSNSVSAGRSRLKSVMRRVSLAANMVRELNERSTRNHTETSDTVESFVHDINRHMEDKDSLAKLVPSIAVLFVKSPARVAEFVRAGIIPLLLSVMERHVASPAVTDATCAALVLTVSRFKWERAYVQRILALAHFTHAMAEVVGELCFYHAELIEYGVTLKPSDLSTSSHSTDPILKDSDVEKIINGASAALFNNDKKTVPAVVRIVDSILRPENNACVTTLASLWQFMVQTLENEAEWILTSADNDALFTITSGLERSVENITLCDTPIPATMSVELLKLLLRLVTNAREIDVRDTAVSALQRLIEQTTDDNQPLDFVLKACQALVSDASIVRTFMLLVKEWPSQDRRLQDSLYVIVKIVIEASIHEEHLHTANPVFGPLLSSINASLALAMDGACAVEPTSIAAWATLQRLLAVHQLRHDERAVTTRVPASLLQLALEAARHRNHAVCIIALNALESLAHSTGFSWTLLVRNMARAPPETVSDSSDAVHLPLCLGDRLVEIALLATTGEEPASPFGGSNTVASKKTGKGLKAPTALSTVRQVILGVTMDLAGDWIHFTKQQWVDAVVAFAYLQRDTLPPLPQSEAAEWLDIAANVSRTSLLVETATMQASLTTLQTLNKVLTATDDMVLCRRVTVATAKLSLGSNVSDVTAAGLPLSMLNVLPLFAGESSPGSASVLQLLSKVFSVSDVVHLRTINATPRLLGFVAMGSLPVAALCCVAYLVSLGDDHDATVLESNPLARYVFDTEQKSVGGPFYPLTAAQQSVVEACRQRILAIETRRTEEAARLLQAEKEVIQLKDTLNKRSQELEVAQRTLTDAQSTIKQREEELHHRQEIMDRFNSDAYAAASKHNDEVQSHESTKQNLVAERDHLLTERTEHEKSKQHIARLQQDNEALRAENDRLQSSVTSIEGQLREKNQQQKRSGQAKSPSRSPLRTQRKSPPRRSRETELENRVAELQVELNEARRALAAVPPDAAKDIDDDLGIVTAGDFLLELELLKSQIDVLDGDGLKELKLDVVDSRLALEREREAINTELSLAAARVSDMAIELEAAILQSTQLQTKADAYDSLKSEYQALQNRFDQVLHQRKHDDAAIGQEAGATKTVQRLSLALCRISDLEKEVKKGFEERAELHFTNIETQRKANMTLMFNHHRGETVQWITARLARVDREIALLRAKIRSAERRALSFKKRCESELMQEADSLHRRCAELAFDRDRKAIRCSELEEELANLMGENRRRTRIQDMSTVTSKVRNARGLPVRRPDTADRSNVSTELFLTPSKSPASRASSAARAKAAQWASSLY